MLNLIPYLDICCHTIPFSINYMHVYSITCDCVILQNVYSL